MTYTYSFRTFDYEGIHLYFPATLEGLRELKTASESVEGWFGSLVATDEDGARYEAHLVGVGPHWFQDYELETEFQNGDEVPAHFHEFMASVFPIKFMPVNNRAS